MNRNILIFIGILFIGLSSNAQQVMVDQGIQAAGLWCFPLYSKPNTYVYLPSRARLGLDQDSIPQFSFMRYILEKPSEGESARTITEAGGRGILHFLILYDTSEDQIASAESIIRDRLENDTIKIRGPVVFESGRYALVSSILNPDKGKEEKKLLGIGEAPVLENSRLALSFEIDPLHSKILLESFKMATPDVSLVFEMAFSGLTEDYEAKLEIDWSEVQKSETFSAGANVYFVSADVEMGFEELRKNHAIKLTTAGSNEAMESLLNTVYNKLLELMFRPIKPETVPEDQRGGFDDALASIIGSAGKGASSFGVHVGYQLKQLNSTGKAVLNFNGRSTVSRKHFITFNAGNLHKKYGDDESVFKDVPLWDPAFQQREIFVGVDGTLEREFAKMINSVTVRIRKQHENGALTTKELLINKEKFKETIGKLSMIYLNQKDTDRQKWLEYEYQTVWQFIGGGSYTTDWKIETASMINLFTPFQRQTIELEGDLASLEALGVRAISVQIDYPFFGLEKQESLRIRPTDNLVEKSFEITLPVSEEFVNYSITWFNKDRTKKSMEGKDNYGLIFIDEIPDD